MFTVTTKIAPATAKRGTRIAARTSEGVRTHIGYEYGSNEYENHAAALRAVLVKVPNYPLEQQWVHGETEGGYVWVCRKYAGKYVGTPVEVAPCEVRLDKRYTFEYAHCGYTNKRYVVRFCDEWVGQAPTMPEAKEIAQRHRAEQLAKIG